MLTLPAQTTSFTAWKGFGSGRCTILQCENSTLEAKRFHWGNWWGGGEYKKLSGALINTAFAFSRDVYGAEKQKLILPFTKSGGAEEKNNRGSGEGGRLTYNEFMQRTVDGLLDPKSTPRVDLGLTGPDPSKGSADLDRAAVELYNLKDDRFKQISKPRILNNDMVNKLGVGNTYPRLMRGISDQVNEWRMQEETGKGETWKKVKPHVDDLKHLAKTISDGRKETTAGSYIPDLMMRDRKTDKGVYIGGLGLQNEGGQVSFHEATDSKLPRLLSQVLGRTTFQEVDVKKTWSENKAILKGEPNNFQNRRGFADWVGSKLLYT